MPPTVPPMLLWCILQSLAIAAGAAALREVRGGSGGFRLAYASGIALAIPGAVLFGHGVEISGMGALFGLLIGYVGYVLIVSAGRGVDDPRRVVVSALDALAPCVGAILAVARIGCFVAGCDFGRPAPAWLPWSVRYGQMTPAFAAQRAAGLVAPTDALTLPVHPTQLYESLAGVLLLVAAVRWRLRLGSVLLAFAAARFGIDFFRGDLARGILGLTTSQLLCLFLAGVVLVWNAVVADAFASEAVGSAKDPHQAGDARADDGDGERHHEHVGQRPAA